MISKQIIDWTTVPSSEDANDIRQLLRFGNLFRGILLLYLGPIIGGRKGHPESPRSRLWLAGRTGSSSSLIDRYAKGILA